MIRVVLAIVVATATVRADAPARDPAAATTAADEANQLAKSGNFEAAAEKFLVAWHADNQRPELLCNVGISYYKAKDLVRAHLLLGQCLDQTALDPKVGDTMRAVVVSVEDVLRAGGHTPVRVVVEPSTATISITELGPSEVFVGSRVVWLGFGTYHLVAHAEGYLDHTETVTPATASPVTVTLTLQRPIAIKVDHPPIVAPPPIIDRPEHHSKIPAILATTGTVLALAVAGYAYSSAHSRAELASSALDPATFANDRDAVTSWNTTFVIAGSLGVVGAVASSYLWYRVFHAPVAIEPQATDHGAALGFSTRF